MGSAACPLSWRPRGAAPAWLVAGCGFGFGFGLGLGLWLGLGLRLRYGFERRCTRGCSLLISALATTCLVRVEI